LGFIKGLELFFGEGFFEAIVFVMVGEREIDYLG
jgi:hypothetical protein